MDDDVANQKESYVFIADYGEAKLTLEALAEEILSRWGDVNLRYKEKRKCWNSEIATVRLANTKECISQIAARAHGPIVVCVVDQGIPFELHLEPNQGKFAITGASDLITPSIVDLALECVSNHVILHCRACNSRCTRSSEGHCGCRPYDKYTICDRGSCLGDESWSGYPSQLLHCPSQTCSGTNALAISQHDAVAERRSRTRSLWRLASIAVGVVLTLMLSAAMALDYYYGAFWLVVSVAIGRLVGNAIVGLKDPGDRVSGIEAMAEAGKDGPILFLRPHQIDRSSLTALARYFQPTLSTAITSRLSRLSKDLQDTAGAAVIGLGVGSESGMGVDVAGEVKGEAGYWKDSVLDYMLCANFISVVLGSSEAMKWELKMSLRKECWGRTILLPQLISEMSHEQAGMLRMIIRSLVDDSRIVRPLAEYSAIVIDEHGRAIPIAYQDWRGAGPDDSFWGPDIVGSLVSAIRSLLDEMSSLGGSGSLPKHLNKGEESEKGGPSQEP